MKKILVSFTVIALIFLVSVEVTYASATFSFGGKVKRTTAPMVTCKGSGTLVVLSSNLTASLEAATDIALESQTSENKTEKKIASVVKGIYGSITFYATDSSKQPKVGDWILGKANIVMDFKTCSRKIGPYKIPYPVRKTSNYNISGKGTSTRNSTVDTSIPPSNPPTSGPVEYPSA